MSLSDPRAALAEQSSFVDYLVGVVGMSRTVHALATGAEHQRAQSCEADDFIHALLGIASIGAAIERLAESARLPRNSPDATPQQQSATGRWLR